eukprot:TRINITY_DN4407_c0_g3_i1.p1 TRINITY_DN4407_c0_g3~~TRINITY_DN4407_c0_g3_i1.p1  ORF type:complete len:480 (-),score=53.24 TRINITY_DN4407_c0_g3_i1:218-1588(-)
MARLSTRRARLIRLTRFAASKAAKKTRLKKSKRRGQRYLAFGSSSPASSSTACSDFQHELGMGADDSEEATEVDTNTGIILPSPAYSELTAVVINLDKRSDRMESCASSFRTHSPWLSYERLRAVDGRKDFIDTSEVTLSWHTGMNCVYQKMRSQRKGWNDLDNYVPRQLKLSPGERGCSLSHVHAWRKCLDVGRPLMVLEDDAKLMPKFTPILNRALAALPQDAQVLYLGYSQAAPWKRVLTPELAEAEYLWTTVGYVVWPSGARHFLCHLPVDQPVDNWMASHCARGTLKAYAVTPKIVRQAEAWNVASDVGHSDEVLGYSLRCCSSIEGRSYLSHDTHHNVDLWSEASVNQRWKITELANGNYAVHTWANTSAGRTYLSHDCHHKVDLWVEPGVNQQWKIERVGEDTYTIQAAVATSEGCTYLGRDDLCGVELCASVGANQHWIIPNFGLASA